MCSRVEESSSKHVITLTRYNRSHVYLSADEMIYIESEMGSIEALVVARACMLAHALAKAGVEFGKLLVHNADELLARVFGQVFGDRVQYSTS